MKAIYKIEDIIIIIFLLVQIRLFGNSNITLATIAGIIILVYYLKNCYRYKMIFLKYDIILIIFYLLSMIAYIRIGMNFNVKTDFYRWTYVIIMGYIIRFIILDRISNKNIKKSVDYFAKLYLYMSIINSIAIMVQFLFPNIFLSNRFVFAEGGVEKIRPFGLIEANFSNYISSIGILSLIYLGKTEYKLKNNLILLFIYICSLLTYSRTGLIINTILLIIYFLVIKKKSNKNGYIKIIFYTFFIGLLSIMIILSIHNLKDYIGFMLSRLGQINDMSGSSLQRYELIQFSIELIKKHPIIGNGFLSTKLFSGLGLAAHNTYIQVLSDQGLIGFFIFILIILSTLVLILKIKNYKEKIFLILNLLVILFYMSLLTFIDKSPIIFFITIVPVSVIYSIRLEKIKK